MSTSFALRGLAASEGVPGRAAAALPPSGGRRNRACGTGDTRRSRSGRHVGPSKNDVNPCPPALRRVRPGSSALETSPACTMLAPMKRTTLGFRKEITVFEYERGLLYRDGKLERVLEPGRYRFWANERVEVAKVSLREMSHVVAGQGILTADQVEVRVTLV